MCLAIPGKVIRIIDPEQGEVLLGGIKKRVRLELLSEVKVGDYVLIHAGYAITRINEREANEINRAWKEIQT